jgi:hypothetical protein
MWELYHPGSPWGAINPDQKIGFDISEGRSEGAARIALLQFYLMVPLAIAGFVILRRRKITIAPLLALPVVSSMAALYAFGNTRYRAISEVAIVALAAITLDAIVTRYWRPDRDAAPGTPPDDARDEALQLA